MKRPTKTYQALLARLSGQLTAVRDEERKPTGVKHAQAEETFLARLSAFPDEALPEASKPNEVNYERDEDAEHETAR